MTEPLEPGDPVELGRYRLVTRLGRGGMGTVFLGQDESGKRVAVKVINAELAGDPKFQDRFRREVAAARRVRRFCTAPVLDASLNTQPMYVVTEYIDGPSVEEAVIQRGPMRGADLEALAVGMAVALSAIHDAGIVHRDLKPANVLLSGVGPRVIDFGIARALDARSGITKAGQIMGTPAYMAPELLNGNPVTPASDVFSWGCVVAFAGTGQDPFTGNTLPEIIHRVVHEPPWLHGVDSELLDIVAQALSKDPASRPTVPALLERLAGRGRPETVRLATFADPPQSRPEPSKAAAAPPQRMEPPTPQLPSAQMQPTRRLPEHDHTTPFKALGIIGIGAVILALTLLAVLRLWPDSDSGNKGAGNQPTQPASPPPSTPSEKSEQPKTSTPPVDPGDVDRRFLGTWTGLVDHRSNFGKRRYSAVITLTGGKLSRVVGRSDYATEGCAGSLTLVSATKSRLVLQEKIDRSPGLCNMSVIVTLTYRSGGALSYEFTWRDEHGTATLRK